MLWWAEDNYVLAIIETQTLGISMSSNDRMCLMSSRCMMLMACPNEGVPSATEMTYEYFGLCFVGLLFHRRQRAEMVHVVLWERS